MNEQLHMAGHAVLTVWQIDPSQADRFFSSSDGLALLALLCNTAAKQHPNLYGFKSALVAAACRATPNDCWWVDTHEYGEGEHAQQMPVYFIETGIVFEHDPLQLAFHFRSGDDLPDVVNAPTANGRRWRGQRAQANATQILADWLNSQEEIDERA
jgi:hypothetical protein